MRGRLAAAAAGLAAAACAAGRPASIMSWTDYTRLRPQWPYVVRVAQGEGELLYYGARHTRSPTDAQVVEIESSWAAFRPTIVFNEGGNPRIESTRELALERSGEGGLVRFLAARDDVPVTTLEPSRAEEVAHLRRTFAAADVKLFYVLRALSEFMGWQPEGDVEQEAERVLGVLGAIPGLGGPPRNTGELAAAYRERFPERGTYRDTPRSWFDPVLTDTVMNRISRSSTDYRDRFMVALLARHVADGHCVFAVVGGTHVVMQERALRDCVARRGRGC